MSKGRIDAWPKYIVGFLLCLLIRLIPGRPPNIEPIFATIMPFSKRLGAWAGFLFGALSIALFDVLTGTIGMWTWITAAAYGLLGLGAHYYLSNKKGKTVDYVVYAIIGTIAYDIVTGLSIGPLFYDQPFMEALKGQIPFTINHLIGNVGMAFVLTPLVDVWIVSNKKITFSALTRSVRV